MVAAQATISAKQAAVLVAQAQAGDQEAFATLYEQYRPLVYRFLRRRLDGADETLEPAMARLTAEQRQAVELRFLKGMSVAETAAQMGRSEEAVKKLQARALANLRRSLTETTHQSAPVRMVRAA